MTKTYDMELFLAGVLSGAHATRLRHIRQAKAIQSAIVCRWRLENPWYWKRKHLHWFLTKYLEGCSEPPRYYYYLTIKLIKKRLEKLSYRSNAIDTLQRNYNFD